MEDYKEKLRLAKEALDSDSYDNETIEYIFPELKESKDECIRKELIRAFTVTADKRSHEIYGNGITYGQVLAWLEKQGEQKPEIKYIYPKFRVGDVIEPAKPNGHYSPVRVKYIGEGNYFCESDDCKSFLSFPVCNENEYVLTEQKPAWSEEDEKKSQLFLAICDDIKGDSATYSTMYREIEELKTWLKSLKDRVHPQLKQEWSEEDYNEIETIACHLDNTDNEGLAEVLRNIRDKYYHIIPQSTWKPSDEQMKGIECTIKTLRYQLNAGDNRLDSLYNDLKKLREK